jgi:hypothetical protein
MTEEKKETSLFQVIVDKVGEVAKTQKLTLPYILGELDLVKKHVTDTVLANIARASEQSEGDDKQEKMDASPVVSEDKA